MLVVITYDVSTEDSAGQRRLRKIAKQCVNYGQRVQKSVFECSVDPAQYRVLIAELRDLMDPKLDSLRIYKLGNAYKDKIEHYGVRQGYDANDALIL